MASGLDSDGLEGGRWARWSASRLSRVLHTLRQPGLVGPTSLGAPGSLPPEGSGCFGPAWAQSPVPRPRPDS